HWSAFALAFSPLSSQSCAPAAREPVFLAPFAGALLLALREQVILSAILLGAAGLVRYDGWLYVPLFAALLWLRQRNLARSVAFCAVAAAPALFWLCVNARFAGDALAPLRHVDRDHAMLAGIAVDSFGSLRARLQHLVYWPFAVCLVATPVFGLLGLWGSARALRRREPGWDLVALAWIPAAYFT